MDHLIPILKTAISDPEIVKQLSCGRTKTTAVIKNVIGLRTSQMDDVCAIMQSNYFKICLDESTDISTTKLWSIVVRTELNGRILHFFFALLKIQICYAESIYAKIIYLLYKIKLNFSLICKYCWTTIRKKCYILHKLDGYIFKANSDPNFK